MYAIQGNWQISKSHFNKHKLKNLNNFFLTAIGRFSLIHIVNAKKIAKKDVFLR